MKDITDLKAFFESMQFDAKRLQELTYKLDVQYELLSSRNNQQLLRLNEQMLVVLDALFESNKQREGFLRKLGLPGNSEGLAMLQGKLPAPIKEKFEKLSQELHLKIRTCNMMNERAGILVANQRIVMSRIGNMQDPQAYPEFRV
ncbi:flagellar protein FlgN [Shewanella sp. A25]|nr:flagellar protein FlgN [Shewanella shenzhenensis]